jgi:hypothetical protein
VANQNSGEILGSDEEPNQPVVTNQFAPTSLVEKGKEVKIAETKPVEGEKKSQGEVQTTASPPAGFLGTVTTLITTSPLPMKIAMAAGVLLLLGVLGVAIWQVVEFALGNQTLLDIVSGPQQHQVDPSGGSGTGTDSKVSDQDLASARLNKQYVTAILTGGAFFLGLGVVFGLMTLFAMFDTSSLISIPVKIPLIISIFGLALGAAGIAVSEGFGASLLGATPRYYSVHSFIYNIQSQSAAHSLANTIEIGLFKSTRIKNTLTK